MYHSITWLQLIYSLVKFVKLDFSGNRLKHCVGEVSSRYLETTMISNEKCILSCLNYRMHSFLLKGQVIPALAYSKLMLETCCKVIRLHSYVHVYKVARTYGFIRVMHVCVWRAFTSVVSLVGIWDFTLWHIFQLAVKVYFLFNVMLMCSSLQCDAYGAPASSETTWTMRTSFPEYLVALATIVGSVLFTVCFINLIPYIIFFPSDWSILIMRL